MRAPTPWLLQAGIGPDGCHYSKKVRHQDISLHPTAYGKAQSSDLGAENLSFPITPARPHCPFKRSGPSKKRGGGSHFPPCAPSSCSCKIPDFHTQAELGIGSPLLLP